MQKEECKTVAKKVLLVDDSWVARLKIGQIVQSAGYHSIEAPSGEEALSTISRENPDLILLDLLMPGMDGIEVLRKLRADGVSIPVIIITADIQHTTHTECLKEGAVSVINKPPKRDELLEEIEKTITQKK